MIGTYGVKGREVTVESTQLIVNGTKFAINEKSVVGKSRLQYLYNVDSETTEFGNNTRIRQA